MKTILLNTSEIECLWEKVDVCLIKMTSGKTWVCCKTIKTSENVSTKEYILSNPHSIVKIPLATKGGI